jgi:5-methylcytosine-specific restriction enzyme A
MPDRRHRTLTILKSRIPSAPQRIRAPEKKADSLYLSSEWRALIARIIAERGRQCQRCGRERDENGAPIRIFGDHVVELRDGGALLDAANVQLLCGHCHAAKTAAHRAAGLQRAILGRGGWFMFGLR